METLLAILLVGGLAFVMMRLGCGGHAGKHAAHGASGHKGGCCGGHASKPSASQEGSKDAKTASPSTS